MFAELPLHRQLQRELSANFVLMADSTRAVFSVGGEVDSTPAFAIGDDSESELEIADALTPVQLLPERSQDGPVETTDIVEYKCAYQCIGAEHASLQLQFKHMCRIAIKEMRVWAVYLEHGLTGAPAKIDAAGNRTISTFVEAKDIIEAAEQHRDRFRETLVKNE